MSELTMEVIEQSLADYPYWVLAKTLAKKRAEQSLIDYPIFPQHDRYRELSWRSSYYEDNLGEFVPLTPAERGEYKELQRLHSIYSNQLDELHTKTMTALKTMTRTELMKIITTFDLVPPENINPKLLTMGEKTLEAWKTLLQSSG